MFNALVTFLHPAPRGPRRGGARCSPPSLMQPLGSRNWWAPKPPGALYDRIGLHETGCARRELSTRRAPTPPEARKAAVR